MSDEQHQWEQLGGGVCVCGHESEAHCHDRE